MLTMRQYAKKNGKTRQRIHQLLLQGRIPGAKLTQVMYGPESGIWLIPSHAKIKKLDRRKIT